MTGQSCDRLPREQPGRSGDVFTRWRWLPGEEGGLPSRVWRERQPGPQGQPGVERKATLPGPTNAARWPRGGRCPVPFSRSALSDSLRPHKPQHAKPPCPSPTPGVYSNSCPSSQWCHPTISSSVVPFSFCPQSFPASGSFPMSHLFASGGQSIEVSASISVLPMNTQDWSPIGWTGWISLQSKGLSRVLPKPQFKSIDSLALSFPYGQTLTSVHEYWKNHCFD